MPLLAALVLVTVRLFDTYGVRTSDLHRATAVTSATLERAGVQPVWVNCVALPRPPRCAASLEPGELIVRFRPSPQESTWALVLGNAMVDPDVHQGTVATVYPDRVEALSQASQTSAARLLGRTMAHEIGHLLLGHSNHSKHGIMRARWTAVELRFDTRGDWVFSDGEAAAMRQQAAQRGGPGADEAQ
jgi:hypothetical protein